MATAYLLRRVVETFKITNIAALIERVQQVGRDLMASQPREMAIGNIVRRVLGVIREEADENRDRETSGSNDAGTDSRPQSVGEDGSRVSDAAVNILKTLPSGTLRQDAGQEPALGPPEDGTLQQPPLFRAHISYPNTTIGPLVTSMFSLLSPSPTATTDPQFRSSHPPFSTTVPGNPTAVKDLRAEIIEGIQEILEELSQADDQIAGYSHEHIHSNEIILTHTSSTTIQKFLLKAAAKRKFTVIHAETFPNDCKPTHATVIGQAKGDSDDEWRHESFQKSLTAAGVTVILIPDSAIYALMSCVSKVILDTHIVLGNGGVIAAAGAKVIAKAASMNRKHVVVLSAVYKLSPVYPFDIDSFMENGDTTDVIRFEFGDFTNKIEFENPLFDYIPPELVDLYITNLCVHLHRKSVRSKPLTLFLSGGYAPSSLYRILADHYRAEDLELHMIEAHK